MLRLFRSKKKKQRLLALSLVLSERRKRRTRERAKIVEYRKYSSDDLFERTIVKDWQLRAFLPWLPRLESFHELCDLIRDEWKLPRSGGTRIQRRKHSLEVILFGALCYLSTPMTFAQIEVMLGVSKGQLLHDFDFIVELLHSKLSHYLQLLTAEERLAARGSLGIPECEDCMYFMDGVDCAVSKYGQKFLHRTIKRNVKGGCGMRAQVAMDVKTHRWRAACFQCCGGGNDQSMLTASDWNTDDGVFLGDDQLLGTDGGYFSTEHITVLKPANRAQLAANPLLKEFNKRFNGKRSVIERGFGQFKSFFKPFHYVFERSLGSFAVCFELCLMLHNRYWDECDKMI